MLSIKRVSDNRGSTVISISKFEPEFGEVLKMHSYTILVNGLVIIFDETL